MTGSGADYAFECAGSIATIKQAFAAARIGWDTCMVVGLPPEGEALDIMPSELLYGKILRGSSVGGAKARTGLPKLVDSLMDSQHKIGIDEINEGFEMMKRGEGIRTVANF